MAKLNEYLAGQSQIGKDGLQSLCNELNARRQAMGFNRFYYVYNLGGRMTLADEFQRKQ